VHPLTKWGLLLLIQGEVQGTSKPVSTASVSRLKISTSLGERENLSDDFRKYTMGARATDSAKVTKFTKVLSGTVVILGTLSFILKFSYVLASSLLLLNNHI
jgi:hypothetical protein